MRAFRGVVYREEPVRDLSEVEDRLDEDFIEVEAYRAENRQVFVHVDHIEAIAIDNGKICTWRFPEGSSNHLKDALYRRFVEKRKPLNKPSS